MGPDVIVFLEPCVDHNLCLFETMEPFGIQDFMAKNAVEAFVVAVFPWAARIDLDRRYPNFSKPFLKMFGNELAAVI